MTMVMLNVPINFETFSEYWYHVLIYPPNTVEPAMSSHPCDTGKVTF